MNRKKWVIVLLVLTVVLIAATVIVMEVRKDPGKALLKIMSDKVDLQVRNVRYTEVGDSGMKWEVMADTARYQKKENLAFFDKIAVKVILKDGRIFIITGDKGLVRTDTRDMEIEGNVKIVSEKGDQFTTDRLRFRNADQTVETDRPVVMENQSLRVSGIGMVFPLRENKLSLLSQVRADIKGR